MLLKPSDYEDNFAIVKDILHTGLTAIHITDDTMTFYFLDHEGLALGNAVVPRGRVTLQIMCAPAKARGGTG